MAFARIGEIDICYEVHGAGPRVVLISGTGGDLRVNPNRGSDPLTHQHEVLMYDQRGLGRTSKPDEAYSMEQYADDAAGLMDHLGWDRAHVVGISFGGMVAQHLALHHRGRIDRLVLACTSAGGAGGSSFDLLTLADVPRDQRAQLLLPIMDTRNDLSTDPPSLAPLFDRLAPFMAAAPMNSDDPAAELGARRQLEARADHDVYERLGEMTMPTLVVGGLHDGQAPPDNLERLAAALPDATLRFFEGGHMFLLQDRTAWPAIIDFLAT